MGKQRPRLGKGVVYTPAETTAYEKQLKWLGKIAMSNRKPLEGPISVIVQAGYPIPASWSQRKRAEAARGEILPVVKPDLDNIAKTLDGLNEVVWKDDAQIVSLLVRKHYSLTPDVKIEIYVASNAFAHVDLGANGYFVRRMVLP
jgi:Holliday junction resolvase RusA-like endonuclease